MADDDIALRPDTLAALQEFLEEARKRKQAEEREAEDTSAELQTGEDWELSQFWYDAETTTALAKEIITLGEQRRAATSNLLPVTVACISCPSTYKGLKAVGIPPWMDVHLLEFDKRFHRLAGDRFHFYDFNTPIDDIATDAPELIGACDIICFDPPFINQDCLAAFVETIKAMRRDDTIPVIYCSGTVLIPHARRLLQLRPTRMHIGHAQSRLQNPFSCYVNYDEQGRLGGFDEEAEKAHKDD